ncbi:MAG: type 1 periplasmic binding fold superfamily protein [Saprospirales bacterium]|nr:type 1 periplasmic binding fold superfamily protein [Saprospirales bacterium]
MKTVNTIFFAASLLLAFTLSSCNNEDPVPVNEEELITTLTLTFTPIAGGEPVVFQFKDPDGIGGTPAVLLSDTLAAGASYTGSLALLNESVTPAADISKEVETEGDAHQFFFQGSAGLGLTFSYGDQDVNGNPLGLKTNWTIGTPGSGTLKVTLRHEPDKTAAGVSDGDITLAGGETDIEVEWPVVIQ